MKTPRTSLATRAAGKPKEPARTDSAKALRLCEEAAARIKAAGDELAECWTLLGRELSMGVSPTELLRRRAWCNVLELRLRERAHALEAARHGMDSVWNDVMQDARAGELFKRFHGRCAEENLFHKSWSLLLQPKTLTARPKTTVISK